MIVKSFLAIFIFSFLTISAQASDTFIGYIKTVKGEAIITRGNHVITVQPNEQIARNDVLKTGPHSSVGITLKDDTLIAMGSNSEIVISEFEFSPGEGKLSLFTRMLKGSVEYVSGIIGKLSPETVKFSTPVGDIGLRGTRFAVRIAD